MADERRELDTYDLINAPQFVDFTTFNNTDEDGDKSAAELFFETHREEDDYFSSTADNTSPTPRPLPLQDQGNQKKLQDVDNHHQDPNGVRDKVNDTPRNKKLSSSASHNSSSFDLDPSYFYTPIGGCGGGSGRGDGDYEDKENCAPLNLHTPDFAGPEHVKKLSFVDDDGTPTQEFDYENDGELDKDSSICTTSYSPATAVLMAQIAELQILSSDDEDEDRTAVGEEIEGSYSSPSKSIVADESFVNALLKTPGAVAAAIMAPTPSPPSASSTSTQSGQLLQLQSDNILTAVAAVTEPRIGKQDPNSQKSLTQTFAGVHKLTFPQSPDFSKRVRSKRRSQSVGDIFQSCQSTMKYAPMPISSARMPIMKAAPKIYVSLAEQISKFQKNTPERYRTRPRARPVTCLKRSRSCDLKPLTKWEKRNPSKSPIRCKTAETTIRNRASSVSMPKSAWMSAASSSRPVSGVSSKSSSGTTATIHKTTIPQPFHFSTTTRQRNPSADGKKNQVSDSEFRGRPPLKAQGQGQPGRPQIKGSISTLGTSLPRAPRFPSAERFRERHIKRCRSATLSPAPAPQTRSAREPGPGKVSRIPSTMAPPLKVTTFKPFSFDQRDQQMLRRKEEKIKLEIEKEAKIPEFHANPLPIFEHKLPQKRPAPPTQPQAFNFKSDQRGASYLQSLKIKLEEEEREFQAMTRFHANPPNVLHRPPFEPELSVRGPVQSLDFQLNTQKRAIEREQFDNFLRQKELESERKRHEEQARLEEQHRLEEIERRRQMVHKAQPFKVPKPFEVAGSKKPLTIPQSPACHYFPQSKVAGKNTSM